MLDNDICDPECNNQDCGYDGWHQQGTHHAAGDCTINQIISSCTHAMEHASIDYTQSQNAGLLLVGIGLEMGRLSLQVSNSPAGRVIVRSKMHISLQWSDARLFSSECQPVLSNILSLSREQAKTDQLRATVSRFGTSVIHLAHVELERHVKRWPDYLLHSTFSMQPQSRSWERFGPSNVVNRTCDDCIEYNETVLAETEQTFDYYFFPFDRQTIFIELAVADAQLVGCERLAQGANIGLPDDRSWFLDTDSVRSYMPVDGTPSQCRLEIGVRRNFIVFFVKQLLILTLIVQGALLALWMNPAVPALLGGRFASQVRAVLMTFPPVFGLSRSPCLLLQSVRTLERIQLTTPPFC